ncbi:MAG: bifunctional riboflavin kinase/FAD synthetase [Zoogloeaceae bacterium]|jgi:riboflavin kinase/FMN adenylyltransferase|nr:bifunctional riboflavin kinase/FAD synthetase [Zoogloeaceae bacterium]
MLVFRGFRRSFATSTVLTIGNFDGVHRGHQTLLAHLIATARRGGLPAAVMTFEPHPREFFSPATAPARLSTLREKLEAFAAAGVDEVYAIRFNAAFAALSAEAFVEETLHSGLHVRHLIIGDDFRFGAERQGNFSYLQAAGRRLGFKVEAMPTVSHARERVSSSAIRTALATGDCAKAETFLGHPYAIAGQVVHGRKLGRQLGFATANIRIRHNPPPMQGVFAVRVSVGDKVSLPGVANLGLRPTIANASGLAPLLEVHLLDFTGNLYGAHLHVAFLQKLRAEMKFADLTSLKRQIAQDVRAAQAFFSPSPQAESPNPLSYLSTCHG